MSEDLEQERSIIRAAIDQTCAEIGESVTTNWIVVAERMDTNGERWLTQFSGDAGDKCPAIWLRRGLLGHALTMLDEPTEDDDDG
jgi:hypothetical protein